VCAVSFALHASALDGLAQEFKNPSAPAVKREEEENDCCK